MTTSLRKVLRELGRERMRAALVVLAIALGLAGFTAVMSSYAILVRELDRGYLATDPAAFTLRLDRVDEALLAAVRAHPEVRTAEARRAVRGRVKAGPTEWRNLLLFVVQDFADVRLGRLVPEEGAWPPAPGELLIERDALQVADARIGDGLTVRMQQGGDHELSVSGSVHDVGQAQARMENVVYGYVTLATLAELGEEPYLDQLLVGVKEHERDEAHLHAVAASLEELAASQGRSVLSRRVPEPGKHPHADIMGLLLLAKAAFGLLVLALSGILVVNLLSARMAREVRQIGVMKALGGSRAQIARIYLGQALILGLAAILVGVPSGLYGGRVLCRAMAVLLNFDLASLAVPAWVFALVAAVGLVVPLGSAAFPVWRGTGVPVRVALSQPGVAGSEFGASAFERMLAGIGGATRPLLFALRNGFRRRTRLVLTLATLTAGGLFFVTALNVRASLIRTLDRLFETRRSDLSVTLAGMSAREPLERALAATSGVVAWEGWIATDAALAGTASDGASESSSHATRILHHGSPAPGESPRFTVLALPADSAFVARNIVEGRDLLPGESDALVANSALAAEEPELALGKMVTLAMGPSELTWRVVGIAREPFSPAVAYVPRARFDELGGHAGMANTLRLVLSATDSAAVEAVRAGLDDALENEGLRALGSSTKAESRYGFDQHMHMIYVFLLIVAAILGGVGALGLATTLSLNVTERASELGVLRALGATPARVGAIVASEGLVTAVLGWGVAALAAWPLGRWLGDLLVELVLHGGLDHVFEARGLLLWLGVSLALGVLASLVPAWHATRRPVRETLARD